jgi:hypothetical protein
MLLFRDRKVSDIEFQNDIKETRRHDEIDEEEDDISDYVISHTSEGMPIKNTIDQISNDQNIFEKVKKVKADHLRMIKQEQEQIDEQHKTNTLPNGLQNVK